MKYCDKNGHCWHTTGKMLLSNPPIVEQVCCHCGQKKTIAKYQFDDTYHGKHKP